jgi:hypothetical protein
LVENTKHVLFGEVPGPIRPDIINSSLNKKEQDDGNVGWET